jgi:hypothetical protein
VRELHGAAALLAEGPEGGHPLEHPDALALQMALVALALGVT